MAKLSSASQGVTKTIDPASPGKAGEIKQYGGTTAPSGYVLCDGQELAEADYPQLFANIGSKYNTGGETASHFRVPNGPNISAEISLDITGAPAGWNPTIEKGRVYQTALGKWRFVFNITGTFTNLATIIGMGVNGLTAPFQSIAANNGLATANAACSGFWNVGGPRIDSPVSTTFLSLSGDILLSAKPTDAFVGADSRFSTFDEALESAPIIKLYDDSTSAVSVSVAEATETTAGVVKKNKWQKKEQQSSINDVPSITQMPDLTFTGLVVGNFYRVSGQVGWTESTTSNTDKNGSFTVDHDGVRLLQIRHRGTDTRPRMYAGSSSVFKATTTTVTAESFNGDVILNSGGATFLVLEELSNYEETTDFT